jgi:uncharacterized membrane protein
MPTLAPFHPIIVHFVVALLIVGVALRWVSLLGRPKFVSAAAATLILLGTIGSFLAVQSGTQAHGPVERIPGARPMVSEHEEWGERTRNVFVGVAALEIVGLILLASGRRGRAALVASAIVGAAGVWVLYEASDMGGDLVYSYAGGVGTRSGEAADVDHVFIAGVYQKAQQLRQQGDIEGAGQLVDLLARHYPGNPDVQLYAVDFQLTARRDAAGALQRIEALTVEGSDPRFPVRVGMTKASALEALGRTDAARRVLEDLKSRYPASAAALQRRLDQLGGATPR